MKIYETKNDKYVFDKEGQESRSLRNTQFPCCCVKVALYFYFSCVYVSVLVRGMADFARSRIIHH